MPPRVAPQQVVVIPIPNSKMPEDSRKVGPCLILSILKMWGFNYRYLNMQSLIVSHYAAASLSYSPPCAIRHSSAASVPFSCSPRLSHTQYVCMMSSQPSLQFAVCCFVLQESGHLALQANCFCYCHTPFRHRMQSSGCHSLHAII